MFPGNEEPVDPADELMFLCLGGGNEVGRSCHIIQYKGKTVMVGIWLLDTSPVECETDRRFFISLMPESILRMMALPPFLFTTNLTSVLSTYS